MIEFEGVYGPNQLEEICGLNDVRDIFYSSAEGDPDRAKTLYKKIAEEGYFSQQLTMDLQNQVSLYDQAGRSLWPMSFFSTGLCIEILNGFQQSPLVQKTLEQLVSGEVLPAPIMDLSKPWFEKNPSSPKLRQVEGGYQIDGSIDFILSARTAQMGVCPIESDGKTHYFIFDIEGQDHAQQDKIHIETWSSVDPTLGVGTIDFKGFQIPSSGYLGADHGEVLDLAKRRATLFLSALMLGSTYRICQLTSEFARTRMVRGAPIGRFQSVSHRLVDMYISIENLKSLVSYGAIVLPDDGTAAQLVPSMAKSAADKALLEASHEGIQLHGARAFQWEHEMNFFLKRALATRLIFGSRQVHNKYLGKQTLLRTESEETENIVPLSSI